VTFDYNQDEMSGPPFAIAPAEVLKLFEDQADVQLLAQHDVLPDTPRFQQRGVSRLHENIFRVVMY
jgi:thiopurine S-methyltransferase